MKCYSLLLGMIITVLVGANSFAQDKASLQPNATILSVLQGDTGKRRIAHAVWRKNCRQSRTQLTTMSFFFPI